MALDLMCFSLSYSVTLLLVEWFIDLQFAAKNILIFDMWAKAKILLKNRMSSEVWNKIDACMTLTVDVSIAHTTV